jgi:uncharacterized protein
MKSLYKYICTSMLLLIVSTGHVFADPISEGQQAYLQGNYIEAVRLVSPLAEEGDILAQYNLGVMYANKESEIHDNKEAFRWFLLAADQGDSDAQVWLGESYAGGRGVTGLSGSIKVVSAGCKTESRRCSVQTGCDV